jgi:predicted ester cyclase
MSRNELAGIYRAYIACLNKRDWSRLGRFVHDEAQHNGKRVRLAGYREMLEKDVREIPDLYFDVSLLVTDPPYIASRIAFDCTPVGEFLGLPVNGQKVSFCENVIYELRDAKIADVWSVVDRAAIAAQLSYA